MPVLQKPKSQKTSAKRPKTTSAKDTKAPSESGAAKSNAKAPRKRKIIYPDMEARLCQGKDAITADIAKQLLGWMDPPKGAKEGVFSFGDVKAFLTNNLKNRPIRIGNVLSLRQEHLRKRWHMNGEPIIIGKTGLVLNGQHCLLSLILANVEWDGNLVWRDYWKSPPVMEKVIIFGVDEDEAVINTLDCTVPRSLSDVLYHSAHFAGMTSGDRKRVSKMLDACIRFLWIRLGAVLDPLAPRRTHSESLDFINRHLRVLEAVKHIDEENGPAGNVNKYLSPGYAAGLFYLMAASMSQAENDGAGYMEVENPTEELLDFSSWDTATEFWYALLGGDTSMDPVRRAITKIANDGTVADPIDQRCAVLILAWQSWLEHGKIVPKSLTLKCRRTDDECVLVDHPTIPGVDLGSDPEIEDMDLGDGEEYEEEAEEDVEEDTEE